MRKWLIKAGKPIAKLAARLLEPITVYRLMGILPYRPIPHRAFQPVHGFEQVPEPPASPKSIHPSEPWNPSVVGPFVMGHSVTVLDGFASTSGHVFDARGALIQGASHKYRSRTKGALVARPFRPVRHIPYLTHNVAVLTASTQRYYYHWLFDVLPRLVLLERLAHEPDLFYLQRKHRFQRETVDRLGLDPRRLIDCDTVPFLQARTLTVPCHEVMDGRSIPEWVCDFLRTRFLPWSQELPPPERPLPDRIYLSRRDVGRRRIRNESAIAALLRDRGFEEVVPGRLSVPEQVRLFQHARAIVAPHGGGLANLVFCEPGTRVIELFPADSIDLYFRISRALGLDYYYLKANRERAPRWRLRDYNVEPHALERTLVVAGLAD